VSIQLAIQPFVEKSRSLSRRSLKNVDGMIIAGGTDQFPALRPIPIEQFMLGYGFICGDVFLFILVNRLDPAFAITLKTDFKVFPVLHFTPFESFFCNLRARFAPDLRHL
jgi:hypothetical protein